MAYFRFIRVPKHQQFEYKTRYWDPKKEELEERLKQIEAMQGTDHESMKNRISSGLRSRSYGNTSYRRQQVMRSNVVLFAVVIGLVLLSVIILTNLLPKLEFLLNIGAN